MTAVAGRGPHTRWTAEPPTADEAAEAVRGARQHLRHVSDAVAAGRDGAAALNTAEYNLHLALCRLAAREDAP